MVVVGVGVSDSRHATDGSAGVARPRPPANDLHFPTLHYTTLR